MKLCSRFLLLAVVCTLGGTAPRLAAQEKKNDEVEALRKQVLELQKQVEALKKENAVLRQQAEARARAEQRALKIAEENLRRAQEAIGRLLPQVPAAPAKD